MASLRRNSSTFIASSSRRSLSLDMVHLMIAPGLAPGVLVRESVERSDVRRAAFAPCICASGHSVISGMRSERPCATTAFGDYRIPALAPRAKPGSLGRNDSRAGGRPEVRVLHAFIDCARIVADFRYIVKRKMRRRRRFVESSFGNSRIGALEHIQFQWKLNVL